MKTIGLALTLILGATLGAASAQPSDPHIVVRSALPDGGLHVVSGSITAINGNKLAVRLRGGQSIAIDASEAIREQRVTDLFVSRPVTIYGHYASGSVFAAWAIQHARQNAASWPPDR